jgi:hypothetical protein
MNRTRKTIKLMATALVLATAVAPTAGAAQQESGAAGERTATELGQAIGEPGDSGTAQAQAFTRTPTELGQATGGSGAGAGEANATSSPQSAGDSGGFDWAYAGILGGLAVLIAIAGTVLRGQRRSVAHKTRAPAASS